MINKEILIRYHDGDLAVEEIQLIENQLSSDKEAQDTLALLDYINQTLSDEKMIAFRNTVDKVHEQETMIQHKSKVVSLFTSRSGLMKIAASIVLAVGLTIGVKTVFSSSTNEYQAIFEDYYEPYQSDMLTRSDNNIINNLYYAFQAYENKDYSKALELFNAVVSDDNTMILAYFYRGISSIEVKNLPLAIESFNKVIESGTSTYLSQSHWYISLAYLKSENPKNAVPHLNWLVENDRFYGPKAKEIITKINKNQT